MALRRRRSTRQLEELPGLFDEIDLEFKAPDPKSEAKSASDPLADALAEHRRKQTSAQGISIDIEAGEIRAHRQLQFVSFGSGSSGNCSYLGIAGAGGIIIDAGVDATKVLEGLKKNAISADKVKGIILTHDHADHVKYAYPLLRKLSGVKLYCTPRTITAILRKHSVSKRIKDFHQAVYKEFVFEVGPFKVTPFEVSHDGTDNVGFCITVGDRNFVVATDMGMITERADYYMSRANYLMIEANYDAAMLTAGAYPEYLKARIRGERGHLENKEAAEYLAKIWGEHLTDVYLCHLSQDNNRPELALLEVRSALEKKGIKVGDGSGSIHSRRAQVRISALPRFDASPLYIHRI